MSEDLPVQGTILSSSQCTAKDAAAMLESFLESDQVPEPGLVRSFLETVSGILEELAAKPQPKRKEKSSRKHREVDHKKDEDGADREIRSGLNAAVAVSAEAENGHRKGSSRKRKSRGVDGSGNELEVETKSHSKRKDLFGDAESNELGFRKRRKKIGGDGGLEGN